MKKRKRKIKILRLLLVLMVPVLAVGLICLLLNNLLKKEEPSALNIELEKLDYSEANKIDIDLYSKNYLLVRLNDKKVIYANNENERFYPASLAKVMTLNTVVNNVEDLNEVSYFDDDDYYRLVALNASLAGLKTGVPYSVEELLYALILPSGGDGAAALEKFFANKGKNLIDLIQERCQVLELKDSNFVNTTGLHDDNLYTTLDDYASIVIDTLQNEKAKEILKSMEYEIDGFKMNSTLKTLSYIDEAVVYGGKTGFTGEAGENIMVLFSMNNKSYMLILAKADGNPYKGENYHLNDVKNILKYLYKR